MLTMAYVSTAMELTETVLFIFGVAILWRLLKMVLYGRISWQLSYGRPKQAPEEERQPVRVRIAPPEPPPEVIEVVEARESLPPPTIRVIPRSIVSEREVVGPRTTRLLKGR